MDKFSYAQAQGVCIYLAGEPIETLDDPFEWESRSTANRFAVMVQAFFIAECPLTDEQYKKGLENEGLEETEFLKKVRNISRPQDLKCGQTMGY